MKKKTQKSIPKPTPAELQLLRVLWERGPSTVRQIHDLVDGETGYSTTLKILQRMVEKGLVTRDESQRSHVYEAANEAETMQKNLVLELLKNAFGGKPGRLVIQALSEQKASAEELKEIRSLIDSMEQDASSSAPRKKGTKK